MCVTVVSDTRPAISLPCVLIFHSMMLLFTGVSSHYLCESHLNTSFIQLKLIDSMTPRHLQLKDLCLTSNTIRTNFVLCTV